MLDKKNKNKTKRKKHNIQVKGSVVNKIVQPATFGICIDRYQKLSKLKNIQW